MYCRAVLVSGVLATRKPPDLGCSKILLIMLLSQVLRPMMRRDGCERSWWGLNLVQIKVFLRHRARGYAKKVPVVTSFGVYFRRNGRLRGKKLCVSLHYSMWSRFYIPFFLLFSGHNLSAQEVPLIRHFSPSDYRAQNQNWSLAQSEQAGWMYAGNNRGLLEFDGSRWGVFSMPENQTVRSVATGKKGEVFCGGFAEFGYWETDTNGRLAYQSLSRGIQAKHLDKEEIWHILVTKDFVLFQSFSTIYKYDYQKVTILQPPGAIMFAREVQGRVLVPVIERGIYELLPDNTFRLMAGTEILSNAIVQFMVPDPQGGIWVGTTNQGMYQVGSGYCRVWNGPLNSAFRQHQLNKAVALRRGGWAIGTILNGVYILDAQGQLQYHINYENGLQNNTVLALCEDRDGNLWVGLDKGIDLVALRAPMTVFSDQAGVIGAVYSAAQHNGRLYVGTNQGVFVRKNQTFELVKGTQGQVWQLQVFDNQLLCGHNTGTFRIDGYSAANISNVTGGWCTVAMPDRPDLLIQGTYTGLVVFKRSPAHGWAYSHKIDGFGEPLKKIAFDTAGNLWGVHPNKGLFRLRLDSDKRKISAFKKFSRADGLPSEYQLDMAQIGHELVLDAHTHPLKMVDSLGQVSFRPVGEVHYRHKWLPGKGSDYFVVDSSGVEWHSGGQAFPLPVALTPNFENIVALNDNQYLFCQESGYMLLDKNSLPSGVNDVSGSCAIRWIRGANGQVYLPDNRDQVFPYKQNSLTIHFAAPFFEHAPLFSWRLDGFSDQWSPMQPNAEKEFINLPPGHYVFRVRSNSGSAEASVAFRISAPWYGTWWAFGALAALFLSVFALIERFSQMRLIRQQARLETDKQMELSRQRLSAEREKLTLEVDTKSRELSNAALNLIRKNEALQHLRSELLQAGNDAKALAKMARMIDAHLEGDHDWEVFQESFNQVHDDFFKRLMGAYSDLTPGDLRLAAYLKMNLSSKEIAPLLNISVRGVENKRYRLRKKIGLPEDANLTEFIMGF